MKYLITGGAGFIGSQLAKRLLHMGHQVTIIDNLTTGFLKNVPVDSTFIEVDVDNDQVIYKLAGVKFDAIFHLAGQSSGEVSFDDPVYDIRTNAESTLKLVNFALLNNCPRFIYASSMSVYGAQAIDRPVNESATPVPLSFYGVGKLASEHYLRIFQSKGLMPTTLRFFNVYGPGQNLDNLKQGMISIYLAYFLKNSPIIVKGSVERFRDFVFIEDVLDALLLTLEYKATVGKVYNVGTGVKSQISQVLALIAEHFPGHKQIEYQNGTPGDQFGIYADSSLLFKDTHWVPKVNLNEGINKMIHFYKHQQRP